MPRREPDPTDAELEEPFTTWVVDTFRLHGWLVHHQRPARTATGWRSAVQGDAGFPDVVAARRGVVVIAELKRNRTSPDVRQRAWLQALTGPGPHVFIWRPRDRDVILKIAKDGP